MAKTVHVYDDFRTADGAVSTPRTCSVAGSLHIADVTGLTYSSQTLLQNAAIDDNAMTFWPAGGAEIPLAAGMWIEADCILPYGIALGVLQAAREQGIAVPAGPLITPYKATSITQPIKCA